MSHLYRHPPKKGNYWRAYRHNGKLYRESLKTKDLTTAKYLQAKRDQETAEGRYIIRKDISCEEVLKEYMEFSQNRKAKKTNDNDEARINDFTSWCGIHKIQQITEKKLDEYLNHRISKDKLSLSSANRYIATIKAWLNFAVRRKIIFDNPIKYVKKYKPGKRNFKLLTLDEIQKIVELAANNPRIELPIWSGLYAGMRIEEAYGLEWPDLDFKNDDITIKRGGEVITKSRKERVVPMTEKFREKLLLARKDSGPCFNPINHKRIVSAFIKSTGIKGINFISFRHAYASYLLMSGVDLYTVSQLLGHSSVKVTEEHYAHLIKDHKKASVKKLPY